MPLLPQLDNPMSLTTCLAAVETQTAHWTWLFVDLGTTELAADLQCHPQVAESDEMSDAEFDEFEQAVDRAGLKPLLSLDQIQDIVDNLASRGPSFRSTN